MNFARKTKNHRRYHVEKIAWAQGIFEAEVKI